MSAQILPALAPELHVTARGRRALRLLRTIIFALVIVGGAFFVATQSSTAEAVSGSAAVGIDAESVIVEEGQSLWEVAVGLDLDRDPRDVVADIVEINHLSSPVVHPGQTLDVPRR
ncbi:LysM peptidoglycan-binding domain-containing protein [Brevibacterium sp.]|uniref:LysM peptidoglycan-binding domain-containing protein n=1 Tax=Brevibacterium sp. TaxID=1701 RepID=UPI00281243DD|nr:LysM peptidoglycan-binding domain-containing protein [Brevibacterium sp.]